MIQTFSELVRFHALRYGGIHAPAAHSTAIIHARRAFGESRVGSPRLLAVARRQGSDGRCASVEVRAGILPIVGDGIHAVAAIGFAAGIQRGGHRARCAAASCRRASLTLSSKQRDRFANRLVQSEPRLHDAAGAESFESASHSASPMPGIILIPRDSGDISEPVSPIPKNPVKPSVLRGFFVFRQVILVVGLVTSGRKWTILTLLDCIRCNRGATVRGVVSASACPVSLDRSASASFPLFPSVSSSAIGSDGNASTARTVSSNRASV